MEEMTVKKVEETPLSEGKTLTELKEELDHNTVKYKMNRRRMYFGLSVAGVGALATLVTAILTQEEPLIYSGMSISLISASFGNSKLRKTEKYRSNYEESYKLYHEALKTNNDNGKQKTIGNKKCK